MKIFKRLGLPLLMVTAFVLFSLLIKTYIIKDYQSSFLLVAMFACTFLFGYFLNGPHQRTKSIRYKIVAAVCIVFIIALQSGFADPLMNEPLRMLFSENNSVFISMLSVYCGYLFRE